MNNKKNLSADTITTIIVAFIAFIALTVGIWDHIETRKHNRLSVTPRLSYDYLLSSAHPEVSIEVSNNGTGPAIIKEFIIYMDEKVMENIGFGGWKSAGKQSGVFQPWVRFAFLNKEDAMRVSETKFLFSVDRKNLTKERIKTILDTFSRLRIVIKYESIYGDAYEIEIDETKMFSNKKKNKEIISDDILSSQMNAKKLEQAE